ncbi:MAG TPA: hypothetical protein VEF91_03725, partial [Verrucomicrobiae bacterium]|nr:hypothetical protein [Verrucomicrobiae bacterium]
TVQLIIKLYGGTPPLHLAHIHPILSLSPTPLTILGNCHSNSARGFQFAYKILENKNGDFPVMGIHVVNMC